MNPENIELHKWYIPVIGILPILVAVNSVATGLAMGLAFCVSFTSGSFLLMGARRFLVDRIQIVAVVVIAATAVSLTMQLVDLWFYNSGMALGIYLPLLAMNSIFLGGFQEYILSRTIQDGINNTFLAVVTVLPVCICVGALRSYEALSLIRDAAGVFLVVAIMLAGYQAVTRLFNVRLSG